jgi:hypothetical protein
MRVFLLIAVVFIALLISLGGCTSTSQEPWMFYQAYDRLDSTSPAPFFLTMEEAQKYCNRMNESVENNYQVSFIAR